MYITVTFDNHALCLRVNRRVGIGRIKKCLHEKLGIPVAEQRLYEQQCQHELGNGDYIQDLEDIDNLRLRMELRTREYYMVKLIITLPDTVHCGTLQFKGRFRRFGRVVLVRDLCSFIIPAEAVNVTLQVGDRVLCDHEYLFQFANGTVITCTVNQLPDSICLMFNDNV